MILWPAQVDEDAVDAVLDARELNRMARDQDDPDDADLTPGARELLIARRRAPTSPTPSCCPTAPS
ncbi:MAG: hypothetical protein R3F60_26475 [bacterium]